MAAVPQGASIGTIASIFGASQSTSVSQLALIVGLTATAPISSYYGKEPTPAPTPAPTFGSSPQITPNSGTVGATQYSVSDPIVNNGNITARDFIINNAVVGGGNSTVSNTTGDMYWRVTATGPGGTSYYYTNTVSVVAPAGAAFQPDGGYQVLEKQYNAEIILTCSQTATWTYSRISGGGGSVSIASGDAAMGIRFTVTASGTAGQRVSRNQKWSVRGQATDGTIRDFTVELIALGDNA